MRIATLKLLRRYQPHLVGIFVLLGLIEIFTLAVCWASSWDQSVVRVIDPEGHLIYEKYFVASALQLSKAREVIQANSEVTGLRSERYRLTYNQVPRSFPVRAWVAASVAVPIALVLIASFVFKVGEALFVKKNPPGQTSPAPASSGGADSPFVNNLDSLARVDIFTIGVFVVGAAFLVWFVPDSLSRMGQSIMVLLREERWLAFLIGFAVTLTIIVHLLIRYKLRLEIVRHQAEIQKRRDELEAELEKAKLLGPEGPLGRGPHFPLDEGTFQDNPKEGLLDVFHVAVHKQQPRRYLSRS